MDECKPIDMNAAFTDGELMQLLENHVAEHVTIDDLMRLSRAETVSMLKPCGVEYATQTISARSKKKLVASIVAATTPDVIKREYDKVISKRKGTLPDGAEENASPAVKALSAMMTSILRNNKDLIDEQRLREIVRKELLESKHKKELIVSVEGAPMKDIGIQHDRFATLLKCCAARTTDGNRINVWLKGPAGTGKTMAAKQVSITLEMPFYFNGAITNEYALIGFTTANGQVVRTQFREAWEKGGVYLFDEVDSSMPNAVLAFNAALANGACAFPDGIIERHKDTVVIAGANTAGGGATSDYNGRMKMDAAFMDRFVILDWPLDEELERTLSSDSKWLARVQKTRRNCEKRGVKGMMISPRATFYGEALLRAGVSIEETESMVLRKGMTEDQWQQVRP